MHTGVGDDPHSPWKPIRIVYQIAGLSPLHGERPRRSAAQMVGGGLGAFVGAAVGLASLVYFIGVATIWFSLRNRGFDPDAAIQHQPRGAMVVAGLRGLFFVLLVTLVAAGSAALVLRTNFRSRAKGIRFRRVVIGSVLALLVASWFGWTWLALCVVVSTVALLVSFHLRYPRRRWAWLWLALPLAALIAGASWQYGRTVHVSGVSVRPIDRLPLLSVGVWPDSDQPCEQGTSSYAWRDGQKVWIADRNPCNFQPEETTSNLMAAFKQECVVPYFGETSEFVYLGSIQSVREPPETTCGWDAGPILEIPKSRVRLRFPGATINLNTTPDRPLLAVWGVLKRS